MVYTRLGGGVHHSPRMVDSGSIGGGTICERSPWPVGGYGTIWNHILVYIPSGETPPYGTQRAPIFASVARSSHTWGVSPETMYTTPPVGFSVAGGSICRVVP